jgi:hypothetical protein
MKYPHPKPPVNLEIISLVCKPVRFGIRIGEARSATNAIRNKGRHFQQGDRGGFKEETPQL